jgi:hypothetical protein
MSTSLDATAEAETLAEQGRFLEAIDLLTAANRQARDAVLERRLLQYRHEAFAPLAARPASGPWPPDQPDRLPETETLPEVGYADLAPDLVCSAVFHHGGLIVRELFPSDIVDRLVSDVQTTMEVVDGLSHGEKLGERAEWFTPFSTPDWDPGMQGRMWVISAGTVWAADSPRTMFDVFDALEQVGVRDLLTTILGGRPAISVTKFAMRKVLPDATGAWHQDSFLGATTRTLNVWIALSDCGSEAPGLDLLPRRLDHFVERPYGPPIDYVVAPETVEELAKETPVVRPDFRAGDALIFDQFLLHQTGAGPGLTKPRYGLECWFFSPSTYPDDNAPLVF